MSAFAESLLEVARRPDAAGFRVEAFAHHGELTKPPGSLGVIEALGADLCAITGQVPPPVPRSPAVAVFAGDHGVVDEQVSAWPRDVTTQMVVNMLEGGAAVNVLARQMGADLVVVDVGVEADLDEHPHLHRAKIRRGTRNLRHEDAMTTDEVTRALDTGVEVARELVEGGADLLVAGDMGIGNTTPAAALVGVLAEASPADVVGRGAGSDEPTVARKIAVVRDAVERVRGLDDPLLLMAALGGFELAAIAGFVAGAAATGVPVVIDGITPQAAVAWLWRVEPRVCEVAVAAHRTVEPAGALALEFAGRLEPILDLDLRLGEGTGALLAVPLVQAAARIMNEMATFDGAGVAAKPQR